MKRRAIATVLFLIASTCAALAGEGENRSLGACRSIVGGPDKAGLPELSEDELKEKMCLSSLSVVRSADPMAQMECRLAYKALFAEFARRHPRKEMTEIYGRC